MTAHLSTAQSKFFVFAVYTPDNWVQPRTVFSVSDISSTNAMIFVFLLHTVTFIFQLELFISFVEIHTNVLIRIHSIMITFFATDLKQYVGML